MEYLLPLLQPKVFLFERKYTWKKECYAVVAENPSTGVNPWTKEL